MSSYITKTLEDGEHIVLRGHYHWTFTACQTISSYLLAFVCLALLAAAHFRPEHATTLLALAVAFLAVALLIGLWGYILRSRTEFAVTDTRFIQKDGILDISIKEIPLFKVETVNFSQSLLQRIVGTGNIELVGSGGTTHKLTYIAHPMEVKKAIAKAIGNKEKMKEADSKAAITTKAD